MKGVLFNVVEEVVDDTLPEGAWDRAIDAAGVRGAYTSLGNYPDEQLVQIVGSLSDQSGLPVPDVLRHAGRHGFAHLIQRHPELVADIDDLPTLLAQLDAVIHPEVLKLYPEATPPMFSVESSDDHGMTMRYTSPRQMCFLAEGLIAGAAEHFDIPTTVAQSECVHDGDDSCVIEVRYS